MATNIISEISDKEYKEIYSPMTNERLVEIIIENKKEIRRLYKQLELTNKINQNSKIIV